MDGIVKDKAAIVTGVGRGIGRAVAILMAQEGAKDVVNDYRVTHDGTGKTPSGSEEVVLTAPG